MSEKLKRKAGSDLGSKKKAKNKKVKDDESFSEEEEENLNNDVDSGDISDLITESEKEENGLRVPGPPHLGILLVCGATNWDLAGRKSVPKTSKGPSRNTGPNLYVPNRFGPLEDTKIRLAVSGCVSAHSVVITENGKVLTWGRNEKGQLGTKDCLRKDEPVQVDGLDKHVFVDAAVGRNHTLFLTDRGTVFACGDNKMGQCGVNSNAPTITSATKIKYTGLPIVKVACGGDFSLILDCKGVLYSFGSPEYGQLGHGTTGEFIAQGNKISYNIEKAPKKITTYIEKGKDGKSVILDMPEIIAMACGANHSVAMDSRKRVYSWGFGGYGRLGHAENKDELIPRLINFFTTPNGRGVNGIYCGSSYSITTSEHGVTHLFGQTKKTGEANMYPKPLRDLHGWKVRSVGCAFTSIVLAADESVLAFGSSPTFGELGTGEMRKSSPTAIEVKKLDGIYVQHVSCGHAHTLMIARWETEEDKEKVDALPIYDP